MNETGNQASISAETVPPKARIESSYVYFLRKGDEIKIGVSANPVRRTRRLADEAAPETTESLAIVPSEVAKEFDAHQKFADLRLHGEWFRAAPELLTFIEQAKEHMLRLQRRDQIFPSAEFKTDREALLALRKRHKGNTCVEARVMQLIRDLDEISKPVEDERAALIRSGMARRVRELAQIKADGWRYIHANHMPNVCARS